MRILLVSTGSGSRGGGEIFLDYLGQGLADRGHEIILWIPAHSRMNELAEKCSRFATIIRAGYTNTYDYRARTFATCFNTGLSRKIASEWDLLQPDVVHLNKQNLEDGLDLLRAARWCSTPSVCTIHLTQTACEFGALLGSLRDWVSRLELKKYQGPLVTVQEARRDALDHFLGGSARAQTIFNGVPLLDRSQFKAIRQQQRRELGLKDDDFLIIGLGRLVDQKRPFVFLDTARKIHKIFPAAKFLWVGDGHLLPKWKSWIANENLESVIRCAGWQKDATPFLLAADLLLHVALQEGLPLALIEAMAAELPCAVTRSLAAEIPLFNESNVLFTDDPSALAVQLQNRTLLNAIAAGARKLIENQFSLHRMIESYENLYQRVKRP